METMHDSQTATKMAAYEEVQEAAKKQLPEIQRNLDIKRGVAAGFKASAEAVISQMRKVQANIDAGELDLDVGRVVITELSQLSKALGDQGRGNELDCARLDGQIKQLEGTIQHITAMKNREAAKLTRDDDRDARREARRELRGLPTAEDTAQDVPAAPGGNGATAAASPAAAAKAVKGKTRQKS